MAHAPSPALASETIEEMIRNQLPQQTAEERQKQEALQVMAKDIEDQRERIKTTESQLTHEHKMLESKLLRYYQINSGELKK